MIYACVRNRGPAGVRPRTLEQQRRRHDPIIGTHCLQFGLRLALAELDRSPTDSNL
jgi:hypothetical protein